MPATITGKSWFFAVLAILLGVTARKLAHVSPLLVAACASACASSPAPPAAEVSPGDPDAAPSLAVLPGIAEGSGCDTARTHQGLLVARQALEAKLPAPPAERSHEHLRAWVDSTVVAWVDTRREHIDEVEERFELEGEPSEVERIVRHAVLGLLHEDTANTLSALPAPAELDSEPEIQKMYLEVLAAQAEPFSSSALLRFRDCADLAYKLEEAMRPWAEFCHARFDRLKQEALTRQH